MDETVYLLGLNSVSGLGPVRLKLLLSYFTDPKLAWEAKREELLEVCLPKKIVENLVEKRKTFNPFSYFEYLKKQNIKPLSFFSDDYPLSLKQIYDPPLILFCKGEIFLSDQKAIAIVGTRKMTGYGKTVTDKFSRDLSLKGITIVSGLARGVDTQAHKSCLEEGGRTIAVLGGGLNRTFPPENASLAEKIYSGSGAVVSEFAPDEPSLPGNFPARNRIIAGLSKAVVVTEAALDSGSLITARMAIDEGREVFAVPGPITSDLSRGPADLIKQGARLVTSVDEIMDELGWDKRTVNNELRIKNNGNNLSETEKQILNCLKNEQKHIDEICRELKKPSSEVSAALTKMEIMGFVKNLGGGIYTKSI